MSKGPNLERQMGPYWRFCKPYKIELFKSLFYNNKDNEDMNISLITITNFITF